MFLLTLPRDKKLKITPKGVCDEEEEYQPREEAAVKITCSTEELWNNMCLPHFF